MKNKNTFTSTTMAILASTLLSGCVVGPDFKSVDYQESKEWLEKNTDSTNQGSVQQWWLQFEDPVLTELVTMALTDNFDLHTAGLRILESRASLGIATGNLFPQTQQMNGSLYENGISKNRDNTTAGTDRYYGNTSVSFDVSWELDFWGRFKRAIESEEADLSFAYADYDDVMVTLASEVARYYINFRSNLDRLTVAKSNVEIQRSSIKLVEARFDAGEVTELDVQQARTLLYSTEATIPRLQQSVRQWANALAFIVGKFPGDLDSILYGELVAIDISKYKVDSISRDALRNRPDVRRSEYALMSQSALIGVSKSELYPHFSLVGSIGLNSSNASVTADGGSSLGDVWKADSLQYFGGPSLSWNILNYGRIKNDIRVQDARYQQLAVTYKKTVQNAIKEADDNFIAVQRRQEALVSVEQSVKASRRATELATIQYKEGLVDYQRVLDALENQLSNEDARIVEITNVALSFTAFYKALGGGWEVKPTKHLIPTSMADEMSQRTNWGDLITDESD